MSHLEELLARWARQPTEAASLVLVDALLEADDPRGRLAVAREPREVDAALEVCAERVVARAGEVSRLRFAGGMLVEVAVSPRQAASLDPALLDGEPRVTLRIDGLPSRTSDEDRWRQARAEVDAMIEGLSRLAGRGLFGLRVGRIDELLVEEVMALVASLAPRALWVDVGCASPAESWPHLEALAATPGDDAAIESWLRACPNLRALHLPAGDRLAAALASAPALEHLDLRGRALSDDDRAALRGWLDEADGRSVRHEGFGLEAPGADRGFDDAGLSWPPPRDRRRVAVSRSGGDVLSYAISAGSTVRCYTGDQPDWVIDAGAEVTALAMEAGRVVAALSDGTTRAWRDGSDDGEAELSTADTSASVDGTTVMIGERRVELGAPVAALAPLASGRVVAVAGTRVWLVGPESIAMIGTREYGGRPVIAAAADTVAWIQSPTAVAIARAANGWSSTSCVYPGTYSGGALGSLEEPLRVADLDVSGDGVVVVALEAGGANVLYPDRAMKVDAFDGEPDGSWIFVYNGQILIAGGGF